jgi:hypothetical protein
MRRARLLFLVLAFPVAACGDGDGGQRGAPGAGQGAPSDAAGAETKPDKAPPDEAGGTGATDRAIPDHVVYDQILVAFKGSYQVKNPRTGRVEVLSDTDRPREDARERAEMVFDLARSGADFKALKEEYTDARDKDGTPCGLIHAARDGVRKDTNEIYRSTLYPGPAAVIFRLGVDEVGLVEHDPQRCPDGWLIVKRLK